MKRFCLKYLGVDEWVETGFKESCYTFKKSDQMQIMQTIQTDCAKIMTMIQKGRKYFR